MADAMLVLAGAAIAATATTWLIVSRITASRDKSRTDLLRREGLALLQPAADRQSGTAQRARMALDLLIRRHPISSEAPPAVTNARPTQAPASELSTLFVPESESAPRHAASPLPADAAAVIALSIARKRLLTLIRNRPVPAPTIIPITRDAPVSAFFVRPAPASTPAPEPAPPPSPVADVAAKATRVEEILKRVLRTDPTPPEIPAHILSPRPVAAPPVARAKSTPWIAAGSEVIVANTRIPGGMIYVGPNLASTRGWGIEPALINPGLAVAKAADVAERIGFWPEYALLSPTARRAFIDWLAGGRTDPAVEIGHVLLFLYGLERRLFIDRSIAEAPALIAEVERLSTLYGHRSPFGLMAQNFLVGAALLIGSRVPTIAPSPPGDRFSGELPLAVRAHLGSVMASGRPFDADDALVWALGLPDLHLRTSGQRCFAELRALFNLVFRARYPNGLSIREPKLRFVARYRSGNSSFSLEIPGSHETLPDVSGISAPLPGLRDMVEASQVELDPYSRLLGRRPEAAGSLEAAMLLPAALRADGINEALAPFRAKAQTLMGGAAVACLEPRALFTALDIELSIHHIRPPGGAMEQLHQRLDLLNLGFEPDRRFGGESLSLDCPIVIFEVASGERIDVSRPAYISAKAAVEVALLATSENGIAAVEFEAIIAELKSRPELSPAETTRLHAFAWTQRGRTTNSGVLKRAAALPPEGRAAVAHLAVRAVLADGQASRAEVSFLERLFKALGFPEGAVHASLHQGTAPSLGTSPAAVRSPAVPGGAPAGLTLDDAKLARITAETNQLSSMLSGIFAEEEAPVPPTEAAAPTGATGQPAARFDGLDAAHGALLDGMMGDASQALSVFEGRAKSMRLLPEGAMETINDWAFERFGEAILEVDGDTVIIAEHLRAELENN